MKKLITTNITSTSFQPIKQGTLDHIQSAYTEAIAALAGALIGQGYDPAKVYVLSGCANTGTLPAYVIGSGYVFYNGEVYSVSGYSGTPAGVVIGTETTTYVTAVNADPVEFTDGATHNVHQVKTIELSDGATVGDLDYTNWVFSPYIEPRIEVTAFLNNWVNSINGLTASDPKLTYRRNRRDNTLTINGVIRNTGVPTNGKIFTLPAGYRPSGYRYGTAWYSASGNAPATLQIFANGDVFIAIDGLTSLPSSPYFVIGETTIYLD